MTQNSWERVLHLISACPKSSVPYSRALPFILRDGCSLQLLSEHLEHARVLGDVDVVSPLLDYAVQIKDWEYVNRCLEHLVEIGHVTCAAKTAFTHLCNLHGEAKVCRLLKEHSIRLADMSIENLESLKL
ncbi:hypothetical protein STCU_04604 [Strigomonas culicis]|nr:hypothetical protein STCU_04604 [Strigomonas culicis]|eukprot:EPY29342.1 hypothetical protein STCU_04604 [Strigomonas culicis]